MTISEKRQAVANKYKTLLGRNYYSQPKRSYCYKKYSDGKYYSDCSSSIALTYKECGFPFYYNGSSNPTTVGMYKSTDLIDVPVVIKNGIIQNPEVLRVGDMLLFAGTDSSRKYAGYVGHVEMVYKISGSSVTICGHGSGRPSTKNLNSYCRSRYNSKTSKTSLGHKGLIKVRRLFVDGDDGVESPSIVLQKGVYNSSAVLELQNNLVKLNCDPGEPDGDFGSNTEKALKEFQRKQGISQTGVYDEATQKAMDAALKALNSNTTQVQPEAEKPVVPDVKPSQNASDAYYKVTGSSVNVRFGPGTSFSIYKTVHKGDMLAKVNTDGWCPIKVDGKMRWVSAKYVDANGICTGNTVNVRKGPGAEYDSVGYVRKSDRLSIATIAGWKPVEISKAVYFISENYVE